VRFQLVKIQVVAAMLSLAASTLARLRGFVVGKAGLGFFLDV
jgi:hypothetical protein